MRFHFGVHNKIFTYHSSSEPPAQMWLVYELHWVINGHTNLPFLQNSVLWKRLMQISQKCMLSYVVFRPVEADLAWSMSHVTLRCIRWWIYRSSGICIYRRLCTALKITFEFLIFNFYLWICAKKSLISLIWWNINFNIANKNQNC